MDNISGIISALFFVLGQRNFIWGYWELIHVLWDHSLQALHNQIEFIKLYKILNVYQAKIEQDMACQKLLN